LAEQNGLLVDEDLLIMQGEIGKLKYINIDTKSLSTISDSLDIPIDGITKYRDIGYIVSNWDGGVYFVSVKGEVINLLEDSFKTADIFYSRKSLIYFLNSQNFFTTRYLGRPYRGTGGLG